MKPQGNEDYDTPMEYVANPLHNMDDNELLSRFKLEDVTSPNYCKYLHELQYRLRRSHITNWQAPARMLDDAATDSPTGSFANSEERDI